jgi:hypothetical protein
VVFLRYPDFEGSLVGFGHGKRGGKLGQESWFWAHMVFW